MPPFCLWGTVHSRDELSEPVEAPWCDSARGGVTGSTVMSKSDTFQGPGGFRTPSAPERVAPDPAPRVKHGHHRDRTGIYMTAEDREGRESRFTQHRKK